MSIKLMTWAFTLPLPPPLKVLLLAVSDNATDEGIAWPGQDTIAKKATQSRSTVGRQLKRLEALGVLKRFERFREDGSQTSDEIRIDFSLAPDEIGRRYQVLKRAEKNGDSIDDLDEEIDEGGYQNDTPPACQNDPPPSHGSDMPGVSIVTPPNEPSFEPTHSPNPSPHGRGGEGFDEDLFKRFYEGCQKWRTMSERQAREAFKFLTLEEQRLAAAASPLHAAECDKAKRKSLDAHKLIGEEFWKRYPHARLPEAGPAASQYRPMSAAEFEGLRVAIRIAERREIAARSAETSRPLQHDLEALAPYLDGDAEAWPIVELGSEQFAAWRDRFKAWLGAEPRPERIKVESYDAAVHGLPLTDPNHRFQKSVEGFRVPRPWPPRKDGTWSDKNQTSGESE